MNKPKTTRKIGRVPGRRTTPKRPLWTPPDGFEPVRAGRQSPRRTVPPTIPAPDYAFVGAPSGPKGADCTKTPDEIERMRRACHAAAEILAEVGALVTEGITTDELDAATHAACIARGGYPSPLNYHGYPKSVCTSVNEVICHGIPDDRALRNGDIVNVDVTIFLDGMHGDTSATYLVGDVAPDVATLVEVTQECLYRGIAAVRPGGKIRDIGQAIEALASRHGYGVVTDFVGHGIGDQFHVLPNVPHYNDPRATTTIVPGMTFTIEPMITMGSKDAVVWDDDWTAVTADLSPTAQFEHTILVTDTGVEVLTRRDGEQIPHD